MLWYITILEGVFLRITKELRKPEKNTQPQLSMNYQTASSIILADSVTDLKNISQSEAAQD